MNQVRLNQDLRLIIGLYESPNGSAKNVRWGRSRIEIAQVPMPRHIVQPWNPAQRFCRVSIPIPANLYDPAGGGKFHYYNNLLAESGLRWVRNGQFMEIPRMTRYEQAGNPFAWVCLHLPLCGPRTTVETLIREFQRFLANPR